MISYIVIVASILGIIIMAVITRKILKESDDDEDNYLDDLNFPKYAALHDEEILQNEYI